MAPNRQSGSSNDENPDIAAIIAQQLQTILPQIVTQVTNNVNNANANGGNGVNNGCSYKTFFACNPQDYDGKGGAVALTRWIEKIEYVIENSGCEKNQKVKYATSLFINKALTWWNTQVQAMGREATIGYTHRFHELAKLVPHLVVRIPLESGEILRVQGECTLGGTKTVMSTKAEEPELSDIPIVKEDHKIHLKLVFELLKKERLYAKFSKYEFRLQEMHFLGHAVNYNGIYVDLSKIEAVKNWKAPTTPSEIRSSLGLAGYYRCFIVNFSKIAKPLTLLTQKNKKCEWGAKQEEAFKTLKDNLCNASILSLRDGIEDFVVYCDTSNQGLELGVVVFALKTWRHYLYEIKSVINTNHKTLQHVFDQKELNMRQRRWIELFSDYECEICYHPGKVNVVADALSRKERVKPRCVRVMAMTIQSGVKRMILTAQSKAFKEENAPAESMEKLARLYIDEIIARHGVPVSIVSDRDGQFTSRFWRKGYEKNYLSVERYVADLDNVFPERSITKHILKEAIIFDVKCMCYLVRAYYSISPTWYYKDDPCWNADLKSTTTEDIISIESFVEVLVLNQYVLVRKILQPRKPPKHYRQPRKPSKHLFKPPTHLNLVELIYKKFSACGIRTRSMHSQNMHLPLDYNGGFTKINQINAIPEVLRSTKLAIENGQSQGRNEPYVMQFSNYIIPAQIKALHYEPETKICAGMLDAINEGLRCLRKVGDCLGTLLDTYTTLFFPLLAKLLPYLMPMWGKDRTSAEKRIAICIFVDVGEHYEDATFNFVGSM
uniref:Putative reverse transcriptase domain-containing protein n=1 Tax=Tanacetum cinerariifolium TaxID=118510 RepID=A0A6L2KHA6_TANCI|nr:putative reverse transcriptase domain-containing protein [Tanacetum cinerariifolium]